MALLENLIPLIFIKGIIGYEILYSSLLTTNCSSLYINNLSFLT